MKKAFVLFFLAITVVTNLFSQAKENIAVIEKAMVLNAELEFKEMVKLFDTVGKRRPIEPFLLHSAWASLREQYGEYRKSWLKTTFVKKNTEYIIQELEFDSGYVELKFGFSEDHKIKSYLLGKSISKARKLLEEKYRTPAYVNSKGVEAKEVSFGTAPFILNGELTMPKNLKTNDKIAAVVLVHGSGPGDRDEKNGPQQPFRDIAYGLATKGIAVVRYDKRTLTYAEECAEDKYITVNEETVFDAVEAVKFLKTQPYIDTNKIIVLGHSLGGMMMPRIVALDSTIAGAIFMAAPAIGLPDKIIEQMHYLSALRPDNKDAYQKTIEEFTRLKTHWYDTATHPRFLPFGLGPFYWADLETYHQTDEAQKIKIPMLFLQGDKDYQVTVATDYDLWKKKLKDNKNVTFKLFSGLTHNMITGSEKPSPDDYDIPANVSLPVIEAIADWVKKL